MRERIQDILFWLLAIPLVLYVCLLYWLCRIFGGKCSRHVRKLADYAKPCTCFRPLPCNLRVFKDCLRKGLFSPFVLCLLCLGVKLGHIVIEHRPHHRVEFIRLNA